MNLLETIETIRRANPTTDGAQPPPIEPLLARLVVSDRAAATPPVRSVRGGRRPARALATATAATAAVAVGAVVVLGRAGGGVDVAAAFANALTPKGGMLHFTMETQQVVDGKTLKTTLTESWSTQNPRRQRTRDVLETEGEVIEGEGALLSTNPPRSLTWSRSQPNQIQESTQPVSASVQNPNEWLREAYAQGRLQVTGQTERDGRHAWLLTIERPASQSPETVEGQPVPASTVVVDASTFAPIENVAYYAKKEAGRETLETSTSRWLSYEELPATPANEDLVQLAAHPGAKIVPGP